MVTLTRRGLLFWLALMITGNVAVLASQEPPEPIMASLQMPSGVWREFVPSDSLRNRLVPQTLWQVTHHEDSSFTIIYKVDGRWYRQFVKKDGNVYYSVYASRLYRK